MKLFLLITFISCFLISFSQDTPKLKSIDSLVKIIDESKLEIQLDSTYQDLPNLGLTMRTYLTIALDGKSLKKYENKVNSIQKENGISKSLLTSTVFYYHNNHIIKIEEYAIQEDKRQNFDWYYFEDKPLYYTMKNDKGKNRSEFLLQLSKEFLTQVEQKLR